MFGSGNMVLIISNEEMNGIMKIIKSLDESGVIIIGVSIGNMALIISKEEMNGIMKIINSLDESSLLIKGVSKTIKKESKEQKDGFLSMLFGTLGASLLENLLTGKGLIRACEGTIRAGHEF